MSVSAQQLADLLPTAIAILNHADEPIFTNRRFRSLLTSPRNNKPLPPRSFDAWSPAVHPDDYPGLATAYQAAAGHNRPLRIEYRTRDEESASWRLLTLTPMGVAEREGFGLGDKGGGSICTIADISQEKGVELSHKRIAEEAQQRKTQQERFIDMISHEVRNPLSAILHCTEDILEAVRGHNHNHNHNYGKNKDKSQNQGQQRKQKNRAPNADDTVTHAAIAQAAETIALCVAHQKKIVDDVLTFSKLDAGMFTLSPRRVRPRRHLATSLAIFRPELRKQRIAFDYQLDNSYVDSAVDWVMADLDRMGQVLINLVSNAIKFTAQAAGERAIRVSLAAATARPPSYPPNVVFFDSDDAARGLDKTADADWGCGEIVYVMVAVRDTGIGIGDEAQKRLFERFNQATPRTETIYGGSGLGLNVSRRLCHLHGGEIGVSSKEGEGSTFGFFFTVRREREPEDWATGAEAAGDDDDDDDDDDDAEITQLCQEIQSMGNEMTGDPEETTSPAMPESPPVTHVEEVAPGAKRDARMEHTAKLVAETERSNGSSPADENRHILLVEDNVINQRIVSRKLQSLGFQVVEANNGREALEAVYARRFDCILMDQSMPVMDGNAATRAIREFEKEKTVDHIPVLGVTANVRAEQQQEMLQSGMDDVIHKPYKMEELTKKIQELLDDS
ncbi:putative sensor histidine kinase/response regulator [Aspergillus clavatus NRRL 1]|uniref:histidine kinase n=1 Tax=Aspergillus clavatus (strain ATCC 1007 / CBS 513.65 / DSM 816 / NCTC 3887 / NRRL 1 / QM 1276 / 107) TaxID=344612 RepID=A1CAW7_ASPCL|nr:two component histidine kinase 1, putative [Aspergillus clavatus NRRL 1]EAW12885.1 two component histidine kinase 1, putative [Aspergillus clavatus NRRL 1]